MSKFIGKKTAGSLQYPLFLRSLQESLSETHGWFWKCKIQHAWHRTIFYYSTQMKFLQEETCKIPGPGGGEWGLAAQRQLHGGQAMLDLTEPTGVHKQLCTRNCTEVYFKCFYTKRNKRHMRKLLKVPSGNCGYVFKGKPTCPSMSN